MSDAIASVIVASAQSVAKVFVIGGIGYGAVKFPRKAPFLPRNLVSPVARFTFHALTIPLIYSTIAVAVSPQSVGNYWFLIVGGWVVLSVSYLVATILGMCAKISNPLDFVALRVASTFPNIVALPILIFPSLCEFPVVYEGYALDYYDVDATTNNSTAAGEDESSISSADLRRECVAQSTTMIFCYFFAWSLAFWSFGYPQLMRAAKRNNHNLHGDNEDGDVQATTTTRRMEDSHHTATSSGDSSTPLPDKLVGIDPESGEMTIAKEESLKIDTQPKATEERIRSPSDNVADEADDSIKSNAENATNHAGIAPSSGDSSTERPAPQSLKCRILNTLQHLWNAVKQTTTSPGFIAMVLAFITACIPPLQSALFEPGGVLRFFGSAMEALGTASSPISTMVVAASLVPPSPFQGAATSTDTETGNDNIENTDDDQSSPILDERPGMTDPNFGPYQRPRRQRQRGQQSSRLSNLRRSLRSSSMRMLQTIPRSTPEMRRLRVWFCLSRLVVAPAIVVGIILAFDCSSSNVLSSVPNLAKLVIIVNSALPGALIVVVLLKGKEECAETAAAVSKVYLPSYLISILTIAAWCSVGLWITLPDEEGNTFCQR